MEEYRTAVWGDELVKTCEVANAEVIGYDELLGLLVPASGAETSDPTVSRASKPQMVGLRRRTPRTALSGRPSGSMRPRSVRSTRLEK